MSGLSPIQALALKRIRYFEDGLKQFGIHLRTGTELEFIARNADGAAVSTLDLAKIRKDFAASPFVEKFHQEGVLALFFPQDRNMFSQFEVVIGDGTGRKANGSFEHFAPSTIARATQDIKALISKRIPEYGADYADFSAKASRANNPSGLHISISPSHDTIHNLFAQDKELINRSARALKQTQEHAPLLFLPTDASLQRTRLSGMSVHSNPFTTGVARGKNMGGIVPVLPASVAIRDRSVPNWVERVCGKNRVARDVLEEFTTLSDDTVRIENRLAGADADPHLAMLGTVAPIYRSIVTPEAVGEISRLPKLIPNRHEDIVRITQHSPIAREIMGDELHEALIAQAKEAHATQRG